MNRKNTSDYGLDLHCTMILDDYRAYLPVFDKINSIATGKIKEIISESGVYLNAIESRVKSETSLAGKLELKGAKYAGITDLTDIVGVRVITFYLDEVDKIASMVDKHFEVDWQNSVDKRKMHEVTSFGYNSLHYICRIPRSMYYDPEHPEINEFRFELQMRTALQHVWSVMHHDTGYKSGIEIPSEYMRNLSRIAGMFELADEQFSIIRTNINDYRRQVAALVANGDFDEVNLDGDTFRSYLQLQPFDKLNKRIAAINQAEINNTSAEPYIKVFKDLGFRTLGDVDRLVRDYSDFAYQFAVHQIGSTDIDIISSTLAIQDLCIVWIIRNGGGVQELKRMFDQITGPTDYNKDRALRTFKSASQISFI